VAERSPEEIDKTKLIELEGKRATS